MAIASPERDGLAMPTSDDQPMTDNRIWQHRDSLALGVVVALAVGLRLYRLGDQGLFLDEAWSWAVSQLPVDDLLRMSLYDRQLPLYFLLLKATLMILPGPAPAMEASVRALSTACSIGGVVLIVWVAGRRWGPGAATGAGLFLGLSSFDVYYAQEARTYSLMAALGLVSYALLLAGVSGRPRFLGAWGLANLALGWLHFFGLPMVGVHLATGAGLWILWRRRQPEARQAINWVACGMLLSATGALPAILAMWRFGGGGGGGTWLPRPQDLLALFSLVTSGLTAARGYFLDSAHLTIPSLAGVPELAWVAAGLLPAGLALYGLGSAWRQGGSDRGAAVLASALALIPIAAAYSVAVVTGAGIWAQRPFLGAAYLLYLWAGVGLSQAPWGAVQQGLAGVALAVSLHRSSRTPPPGRRPTPRLHLIAWPPPRPSRRSYWIGPTWHPWPTTTWVSRRMSGESRRVAVAPCW
jgi:mannosyltransferase